jgi:hypothetical protein
MKMSATENGSAAACRLSMSVCSSSCPTYVIGLRQTIRRSGAIVADYFLKYSA